MNSNSPSQVDRRASLRAMMHGATLRFDVSEGRVILTEANGVIHFWRLTGTFEDDDRMDRAILLGLRDEQMPLAKLCVLTMIRESDGHLRDEFREAVWATQAEIFRSNRPK